MAGKQVFYRAPAHGPGDSLLSGRHRLLRPALHAWRQVDPRGGRAWRPAVCACRHLPPLHARHFGTSVRSTHTRILLLLNYNISHQYTRKIYAKNNARVGDCEHSTSTYICTSETQSLT